MMKKKPTILLAILIIATGMGGCDQSAPRSKELVTIDVAANYPEKKLILQDFMDVEYVPLETTDEFITQGVLKAVGKDI